MRGKSGDREPSFGYSVSDAGLLDTVDLCLLPVFSGPGDPFRSSAEQTVPQPEDVEVVEALC